ncbi:hypothetical protein F4W66_24595 (plasmid) [Escherichia coli]|nr:hypothetical protein F4W66_24595 [Escherichia coli]
MGKGTGGDGHLLSAQSSPSLTCIFVPVDEAFWQTEIGCFVKLMRLALLLYLEGNLESGIIDRYIN